MPGPVTPRTGRGRSGRRPAWIASTATMHPTLTARSVAPVAGRHLRRPPVTASRGSVRHQVRLACPGRRPSGPWSGDPTRLIEWFPGIESCTVDGDERVVTTRSGLPMPERLLTVDPALRRFQYRITSPLFKEHLGTIDVHDLEDGTCLVVYSTDAEPAPLALVIGGAARAGLAALPEVAPGPSVARDGSPIGPDLRPEPR